MKPSKSLLIPAQLSLWGTYLVLLPFSGFHWNTFGFELIASLLAVLGALILRRKGQ